MPNRIIDSHCHASFSNYENDRDVILERARKASVSAIINPGTDLEQSRLTVSLASQEPDVWAAVGIHPQNTHAVSEDTIQEIESMTHHERVIAIGEIGFEHSDRAPEISQQRKILTKFMEIGRASALPYIFHIRNAHSVFREFLDTYTTEHISGVVHCFSGTVEDAKFYTDRGLYLGFTGIVTFPNAQSLRDIVSVTALENILVETDAPFLAPQLYRGKRNEPSYIWETVSEISRIKGLSVEEVAQMTTKNAETLFRLTPSP